MTPLSRIAVVVGAWSLMASCIADISGAPCVTKDTCPLGQYCTTAGLCAPVESLAGSGGGSGGATGGGSGLAPIGASCTSDAQCASSWCYTDNPGGECTSECETDADCGSTGTCDADDDDTRTCYLKCVSNAGCRSGYECSSGLCLPQ